jgi:hypothetical protein
MQDLFNYFSTGVSKAAFHTFLMAELKITAGQEFRGQSVCFPNIILHKT